MAKRKKDNTLKKVALSFLFILGMSIIGLLLYEWRMIKEAHFSKYPAFGISLPSDYEIHGIDVSHHQSFISWNDVQRMKVRDVQLKFAVMKATEGLTKIDFQFKRNWKKSKEAGLVRGAYHFMLPNKSGIKQAQHFIRNVRIDKGDLPPVLDIEEAYGASRSNVRKQVKAWLQEVEKQYGVKPIIYTYIDFYNLYLGSDFDEYPLWIAHYIQRKGPRIAREWTFWQHSEKGRVNGIISNVDFNVYKGSDSEFQKLLIK